MADLYNAYLSSALFSEDDEFLPNPVLVELPEPTGKEKPKTLSEHLFDHESANPSFVAPFHSFNEELEGNFNFIKNFDILRNAFLDYAAQENKKTYSSSYYECQLCSRRKVGRDILIFPRCFHYFCFTCMKIRFQKNIRSGAVALVCFAKNCHSQAGFPLVKKVVDDSHLSRYKTSLRRKCLQKLGICIEFCAIPECQYPLMPEMKKCPACDCCRCLICRRMTCSSAFSSQDMQNLSSTGFF